MVFSGLVSVFLAAGDCFAGARSPAARPPAALSARVKRAVVAVIVEGDGATAVAPSKRPAPFKRRGGGVVIAPNGIVLTAAKLLTGAKRIRTIVGDGWVYDATVLGVDAVSGLAVLKIKADNLKAIYFKPLKAPRLGEQMAAVGCFSDGHVPDIVVRYAKVASSGRIVRKGEQAVLVNLELDAAMPPGFLGAGVFNASGDLVGVVRVPAFKMGAAAGCLVVPVTKKTHAVAGMLQAGRRPDYNGVLGLSAATEVEKDGGRFRRRLVVRHVIPGGPAHRAGVRKGDTILAADGIPLAAVDDLKLVVRCAPVNTPVELTVEQDRGGKKVLETTEVIVRALMRKQGSKQSDENP